ncbi:MAG: SAM-dependent methyltransferase, partial [Bacteroidia bacterium]|nr:SAM-dependent methyltransferase [Bacteroidia bacterium]
FFCALLPEQRDDYVKKTATLMHEKSKLVGVLFNCEFPNGNPPFGGNEADYKKHFEPYFTFNTFELAYNSIKPRQGSELFINLSKKET